MASLRNQFIADLVGPPIMTCVWWVLSRGWAKGIQGPQVSDRTKNREKVEFVVLLVIMYIGGFGITIYLNFIKK